MKINPLKYAFIMVILFLCVTLGAFANPASKYTAADYDRILKQVKKQDPDADFFALRMAYTKTANYSSMSNPKIKELSEVFESKDYAKAVELADKELETDYVSMDLHMICYLSYKKLGKDKEAAYHLYVVKGLGNSFLKGKRFGKSAKNAIIVIKVSEEYSFLDLVGGKAESQKLVSVDGHSYDVLSVKSRKSGQKTDMWFNVDIPHDHFSAQLKKASKDK